MNIIKYHDYSKNKNVKYYNYLVNTRQKLLKSNKTQDIDKIIKLDDEIEKLKYDIIVDDIIDCYQFKS